MSETDIIDQIDALVDEQLSNYDRRSGYDHNVNQERCRCGSDWHGLPRHGCPGSAVEGPIALQRGFAHPGILRTAPLRTAVPTDDVFDPSAWRDINFGFVQPHRFSPWRDLLFRQVLEFAELQTAIVALGGTWNDQWTIEEARAERDRLAPGVASEMTLNEAIWHAIHFQGVPDDVEVSEPDTRTPQQRALPQPSTTPPMWAHDPTRSRRPRRRRGQPTRQGIA